MNSARGRIAVVAIGIILTCATSPLVLAEDAVSLDAPTLRGPITRESVDILLGRLKADAQRRQRWIIVSSPGGDVAEALRLAEYMKAHDLSIYVDGLCASSCANYLFVAARTKVLRDGALVAWHGSPASEHIDGVDNLDAEQQQAFESSRREMVARERKLLGDLHVDPRLLCVGDRTMHALDALGWTMPIRAMKRFGLRDVITTGSAPIPLRVPNHAEPIVVIDPQPDCARTYAPISAVAY